MKIKEGYLLRRIADTSVVVAAGEVDLGGIITLNDTASFLFERLAEDKTEEALLQELLQEYDVDEPVARADLKAFLLRLQEADLMEGAAS